VPFDQIDNQPYRATSGPAAPFAEELVARAGLDAWTHHTARSLPGQPHLTEPG
jgi:hypothetical protein